jgi:hypothetical protein
MIGVSKKDIYDVISGKSKVRFGESLQAIACYLKASEGPGEEIEDPKSFKSKEESELNKAFPSIFLLRFHIPFDYFISSGAEQSVFLIDGRDVIKLNDGIFYRSWRDYFTSVLLHNYFFPDTAYDFLGFVRKDGKLLAVVKQVFVSANQPTNLISLSQFLSDNGFKRIRNNDYQNHDLGLILEDLHEENVLTSNGLFFFIDTVFYLSPDFWLST